MRGLYGCKEVEKLFQMYYDKGGETLELKEGSLGYGTTICFGEGLKTAVIQEVYLNPWSSAHKVRFYRKMPEKYERMIEKIQNA